MERFDVIVIGSGALGSSTAFHLARLGRKVALLDKSDIASQTSARAAGLSGHLRQTEAMTKLSTYAVGKIERFSDETGEPIEFYQPGSMSCARRPEDAALIRERVAMGERLGISAELISPEEARARNPFLETKGILAVSYMKRDLYLEPVQLPRGYARAAAKLGATLIANTRVIEIVVENGAATRVVTDRGEFAAGTIVDAAGGWLRLVAALAGAQAPVVPMRHQLMITTPLAAVKSSQPVTRILDANVYVRPDRGGLMFGGYERDPMPYDRDKLASDFKIEDLELDLTVLRRLTDSVKDQFPIFQEHLDLQVHRGGLPTMTVDGEHIVGETPGVRGLYVIGGCNVGGLSVSPALGEMLSELITTGETSLDISRMSPSRFAAGIPEQELQERCRERYAKYYTFRIGQPPVRSAAAASA
ncbi:FAD-binding oxidoreductase [Bradyrhizobium sp. Ec3.3]|uniref:NAD(P)/FAD-dependent oxidoreductase n=1 Tax=Bradyrhizobium sp. Ec3.3 TaxID=189753 RepID=UPI000403E303|nr:FAD-binding oxidoreductase [Bradyrhizobium sp. Ec3.3]